MKLILKTLVPAFFIFFQHRFRNIAKNPKKAQEKVLRKLLRLYAQTQFGKNFHITTNLNYQQFCLKLPIQSYEDLKPYLELERSGSKGTIVPSKVVIWEKTSGSSGRAKYIPYTFSLLRSFRRLLFYWAGDLILHGPKFKTGKIFFSISPAFYDEVQDKIVRNHSFEDDSEYLPWYVRLLLRDLLINPKGLKSINEPSSFKLYLCSHLISQKELEVLFVWSPTYLIELVEFMQKNRRKITEILNTGQFEYRDRILKVPQRYDIANDSCWENITLMWKELKLISCWTDGSAELFIPKLKKYFPNIKIQGKGLLATEGPMTFPIEKASGAVPLPEDIFYEFISPKGEIKLLHELILGETYQIIISHASGVLRYSLGDEVKVVDYYEQLPCLKFMGRFGNFSDMTGEKLSEVRVQEIFLATLSLYECACLLPVYPEVEKPYYACLYDGENANFEEIIEKKLMETFHYMQSRKLGQLESVKCIKIKSVEKTYMEFNLNQGMMLGDIKFSPLIRSIETASKILKFIQESESKTFTLIKV